MLVTLRVQRVNNTVIEYESDLYNRENKALKKLRPVRDLNS